MKKFAVISPDGLFVEAVGSGRSLPDGVIELPLSFDLNAILLSYAVEGRLVPRPAAPVLAEVAGGFVVSDCPPGTVITVTDIAVSDVLVDLVTSVEDPSPAFSFPDPGIYQFEILPPFPYLSRVIDKEVI